MTQVCNTLMEHVLQVLEDMGQSTDGISIQYPQVQMTMTCSDINSAARLRNSGGESLDGVKNGGQRASISACRKTSVQTNPPESWRGSSRGRQPASSGIECPECLAWQGVQRAQRGLFRRAAAGK